MSKSKRIAGDLTTAEIKTITDELVALRERLRHLPRPLRLGRAKTSSWLGVGRECVAFVARATGMPRPAKLARQRRYARQAAAGIAKAPSHASATPSAKRRRRWQAAATKFQAPHPVARPRHWPRRNPLALM